MVLKAEATLLKGSVGQKKAERPGTSVSVTPCGSDTCKPYY